MDYETCGLSNHRIAFLHDDPLLLQYQHCSALQCIALQCIALHELTPDTCHFVHSFDVRDRSSLRMTFHYSTMFSTALHCQYHIDILHTCIQPHTNIWTYGHTCAQAYMKTRQNMQTCIRAYECAHSYTTHTHKPRAPI